MNLEPAGERTSIVGLMADPGAPRKVANGIADKLADDLRNELGGSWRVVINQDIMSMGPEGHIDLSHRAPGLLERYGWDFLVYVTDLPTLEGREPLLYEVADSAPAALICLPVFGVTRVRTRVRRLALQLISAATSGSADTAGAGSGDTAGTGDRAPTRHLAHLKSVRLLAGMVLNNRPYRLATSLSGVVVTAAAAGAWAIFFGSIIRLADSMMFGRLLMVSLVSIATLAGWLIVRNGLWNPRKTNTGLGSRRLDNAATVITVGVGVLIMFLGLVAAMLMLAVVVLSPEYLESRLERAPELVDYVRQAWLAGCLGTFAGALGSNFDSQDAIREATYSLRWRQRRRMFDNYADSPGSSSD